MTPLGVHTDFVGFRSDSRGLDWRIGVPRKKLPEDSKKTALTQRKRPQQQRSLVTMQSIHQAALELTAQGGFETLSAARIAERAGIGVGSFYV